MHAKHVSKDRRKQTTVNQQCNLLVSATPTGCTVSALQLLKAFIVMQCSKPSSECLSKLLLAPDPRVGNQGLWVPVSIK